MRPLRLPLPPLPLLPLPLPPFPLPPALQRYFLLEILKQGMDRVVQEGETSVGRVAMEEGAEGGEEVVLEGLHEELHGVVAERLQQSAFPQFVLPRLILAPQVAQQHH